MYDWRPFVYGGIASVTAEFGTFPIDTTKTRLQVQGQRSDTRHHALRYRGMVHAFVKIAQEEGVRALYSGLAPALFRQASYGTIKFGIYHSMKRLITPDRTQEKLIHNVFCGVCAGIISSSVANPTDVLKVRMQAEAAQFRQKGMFSAFMEIFRTEGVRGLWRGVGPTANRAAVVVGVELPVYDVCKKHLLLSGNFKDNPTTHFLASCIAGFGGAVASNPIDVVKTRMMNQKKILAPGNSATVIYTGSLDCLVQTYRNEGFSALYKGFVPNWLRLGPWAVIFFITFEQLNKLY